MTLHDSFQRKASYKKISVYWEINKWINHISLSQEKNKQTLTPFIPPLLQTTQQIWLDFRYFILFRHNFIFQFSKLIHKYSAHASLKGKSWILFFAGQDDAVPCIYSTNINWIYHAFSMQIFFIKKIKTSLKNNLGVFIVHMMSWCYFYTWPQCSRRTAP